MAQQTKRPDLYTLDLNFLGIPGTIAAYLIPHPHGAILVECGPGSTLENLKGELARLGLKPSDITDVFVTHIHLDHAGSAGWWARQGARIHVHPVGAPHLENPTKLLESASRIYGEKMDELWGEFLPVPPEKLVTHEDQQMIEIEGINIKALDTPGHAYHHFAYIYRDVCFTGDVGAVRVTNLPYLRLPMPPPELNLELWRASINKLEKEFHQGAFSHIAPTHFGVFADAGWHLDALEKLLDEVENWIIQVMSVNPTIDQLNEKFLSWTVERAAQEGLTPAEIQALETANPSWMSAAGIYRYWNKVRVG